jgi:hypothetical protein
VVVPVRHLCCAYKYALLPFLAFVAIFQIF